MDRALFINACVRPGSRTLLLAILKLYLENVTVFGITFDYSSQGIPDILCRAKALY